ncbi:KGK domain-containing protein [Kovacikia minuta CCNUW1]|uniref:KGK domain-containing protein n=1 Tax=Kovacikia minuta TaxID=2931930 RepID=UPI001CC9F050|nr:KGK domain-containing protein [Kovacikia minuta]UBF27017.1 KGK domain-containing protein [Kovacikia minuta CCNUW1]
MNNFEPLDDDEVLFISVGRVLMTNPTFKVGEFIDSLAQAISDREDDWVEENEGWFGEGLACEALRFGNRGWQRGRVRIRLEFCPDESAPPKLLDSRSRVNRERRRDNSTPNLEDTYRPEKLESRFDPIYGNPEDDFE